MHSACKTVMWNFVLNELGVAYKGYKIEYNNDIPYFAKLAEMGTIESCNDSRVIGTLFKVLEIWNINATFKTLPYNMNIKYGDNNILPIFFNTSNDMIFNISGKSWINVYKLVQNGMV